MGTTFNTLELKPEAEPAAVATPDPARLDVVGEVVDQGAVLVEEDRFHVRATKFHAAAGR